MVVAETPSRARSLRSRGTSPAMSVNFTTPAPLGPASVCSSASVGHGAGETTLEGRHIGTVEPPGVDSKESPLGSQIGHASSGNLNQVDGRVRVPSGAHSLFHWAKQ